MANVETKRGYPLKEKNTRKGEQEGKREEDESASILPILSKVYESGSWGNLSLDGRSASIDGDLLTVTGSGDDLLRGMRGMNWRGMRRKEGDSTDLPLHCSRATRGTDYGTNIGKED